jgi:hypothetical protein
MAERNPKMVDTSAKWLSNDGKWLKHMGWDAWDRPAHAGARGCFGSCSRTTSVLHGAARDHGSLGDQLVGLGVCV